MGKKKMQELRELPIAELEDKVTSMKGDLSKEKAQISSGTRAENPGKIKKIRRDIARALTLINEKKILGEKKGTKTEEKKEEKKVLEKKVATQTKKKKTKKTKKKTKKRTKKTVKKVDKKKEKKLLRKRKVPSKRKKKKGGNEKK